MLHSRAIPRALLNLINPDIVDSAIAGIIHLPWGIRILDRVAIDNTGFVEPVHMFIANTGSEISILLHRIVY